MNVRYRDPAALGAGRTASGLSSVVSAIRVLKSFSENEPELGITDLSRRLGLAKSTVHRLAASLVAENLLERNMDSGRYRLGLELFALGTLVRRRMDVSKEAQSVLVKLRELTDESVQLAILDQTSIIYLFYLESRQAIRTHSSIGVRKPAYCTSEGRAILAFQHPEIVARVLLDGLAARHAHTITDPAAFRSALDQVRREGYALDDEESEVGVRGLAAPVRDSSANVVAAVGLSGPAQRLSKRALRAMVPKLIEAALTISQRIGFRESGI